MAGAKKKKNVLKGENAAESAMTATPETVRAKQEKPSGQKEKAPPKSSGGWTFLTNHGHVLICLAREPEMRLRDVALQVAITERAVQRIVADLEEARVITRRRDGRRNAYEINFAAPLRHDLEAHRTIRDLLDLVGQ